MGSLAMLFVAAFFAAMSAVARYGWLLVPVLVALWVFFLAGETGVGRRQVRLLRRVVRRLARPASQRHRDSYPVLS